MKKNYLCGMHLFPREFKLKYFLLFINFIALAGCYKETLLFDDRFNESLNFVMRQEQEDTIYNAHNVKLDIEPNPRLFIGERVYEVDDFELRGESALRFRKKSFNVRTAIPLEFNNPNISNSTIALRELKLISLVSDYTFIENRITFDFFKQVGVQPLFFIFKEVLINSNTQGLYLLVESPASYTLKQNHECLIRRGRAGAIADSWFYANYSGYNENDYHKAYYKIYNTITQYAGHQLYDSLQVQMNLKNYFRKIAIDLLIKNGDTSDEIFFIGQYNMGEIYFDIIPWDCDDVFEDLPHEIGRDYGVGNLFGKRSYSSMDDVIKEVGEKLVFSIEDDLDYIIAKDTFLYQKYLAELEYVLNHITDASIEKVVENTQNELNPFLVNDEIIAQTKYGEEEFSYNDFNQNIGIKQNWIVNRRSELINKLNEHKNLNAIQK